MTIGLYEASVPVFVRYLDRLAGLVEAAELHHSSGDLGASEILGARLVPDMLPVKTQVSIANNFALRTCFPLAGRAVPPYGEFAATFVGLRSRIANVITLLNSLERSEFAGGESRVLDSKPGDAIVSLKAPAFLLYYGLPNFFFHVTSAYAILRSRGVAIGKGHFDGLHFYAPAP